MYGSELKNLKQIYKVQSSFTELIHPFNLQAFGVRINRGIHCVDQDTEKSNGQQLVVP